MLSTTTLSLSSRPPSSIRRLSLIEEEEDTTEIKIGINTSMTSEEDIAELKIGVNSSEQDTTETKTTGVNNSDIVSLNVHHLSYIPVESNATLDLLKRNFNLGIKKLIENNDKQLRESPLHDVHFRADSRTITTILGSANERRELIELLVRKKKSGTVKGNITISGENISSSDKYSDCITYVPKKTLYIPGLTYREILLYSARLKMKNSNKNNKSSVTASDRVEDILTLMNLQHCKDRKITNYPALKGVLGCELRRLDIALDIIDLPPVIIIEEPTLSFESSRSMEIIECLKALTERGHVVVCSMEKPYSMEITSFDNVILLSKGYSIYCSSPYNIVKFFCSPLLSYDFKTDNNLVDFLLDISSGVERPTSQRTASLPQEIQSTFQKSIYFTMQPSIISDSSVSAFSSDLFFLWGYLKGFESLSVSLYRALMILQRAFLMKVKDTELMKKSLFVPILVGLVIGYLQYNQGNYGDYSLSLLGQAYVNTNNLSSTLFFSTSFVYVAPSLNVHVICEKIRLFRYERSVGFNNIFAFYFSTVVSEVPFQIVYTTIYASLIYSLVNLSSGVSNYFFFVGVLNMFGLIGLTTTHLISSLFRKELLVRDMMLLIMLFLVLLGGYVFQIPRMNTFLLNMAGFSPTRWCFEGIMNWKFSFYADGDAFLNPFGFGSFHYTDTFKILGNFLIFGNCVFVVSLMDKPCFLKRVVDSVDAQKASVEEEEEDNQKFENRVSINSRSRFDELVKPALFRRESSVTGYNTKLSMNLSCIGLINFTFYLTLFKGADDGNRGPTVYCENISCQMRDMTKKTGYKVVLRNIHCRFDWGKLSLIMGASSSGKSTLLRVLAGEKPIGNEIQGKVLINGVEVDPKIPLWQRCGFVQEESIHYRDLTVKEVLTFAIQLRSWDLKDKSALNENLSNTITNLSLEDIVNKKSKKLSPSELKRLSIAEEMVHGPNFLIVDEAVKGVPIIDASSLMTTFREMVNQDRTVVVAITQPTYEIFKLFDSLLLLSQGQVIYHGPIKSAMKYFVQSPFSLVLESYNNPADLLLDLSAESIFDEKGGKVTSISLAKYYTTSEHHKQVTGFSNRSSNMDLADVINPLKSTSATQENITEVTLTNLDEELVFKPSTKLPYGLLLINAYIGSLMHFPSIDQLRKFIYQSSILLRRAFLDLSHGYELIIGSCMVSLFFGLIFGWLMGNCTDVTGIYDVTSLYAIGSMFILFTNVQFAFYLFNNNVVYLKEYSRELYNIFPHWLVTSIPVYFLRCINITLYCMMVYPIIGFGTPGDNFGFFIFTSIMYIIASIILAEMSVTSAATMRDCYIGISVIVLLQYIISGLFIKPSSLPYWLAPWTPSISLIRWQMQSNFISTYSTQTGVAGTGQLFLILPSGYSTYDATLSLFGWGGKTKWFCFSMLVAEILVVKGIVFIVLGLKSVMKKGNRIGMDEQDKEE